MFTTWQYKSDCLLCIVTPRPFHPSQTQLFYWGQYADFDCTVNMSPCCIRVTMQTKKTSNIRLTHILYLHESCLLLNRTVNIKSVRQAEVWCSWNAPYKKTQKGATSFSATLQWTLVITTPSGPKKLLCYKQNAVISGFQNNKTQKKIWTLDQEITLL